MPEKIKANRYYELDVNNWGCVLFTYAEMLRARQRWMALKKK